MSKQAVDAAVVYDLRLKDPGGHMLEVSCRISEPDPQGQVVSLPNWIPGSYLIRDFARHIVNLEATSEGDTLHIRKIDKSTWRVAPVAKALTLRAEIYANDLSVRGAFFDASLALINGVCVFLKVHGCENRRSVVHIGPPEVAGADNWQLVTGLARLSGGDRDFGAFAAGDYDELIDHPILLGELDVLEFDVQSVPHEFAISGAGDGDLDRLRDDVSQLCNTHAEFFGGPLPMERYSFLLTALEKGYGGLEHRASSALCCAQDDLPTGDASVIANSYRQLLGLISHEYFHLWNVKRIRPREFVESDLVHEAYTRQLWVFEGITSYYDDLLLLRSGLITPESYLDLLGRTLTSVYRSRGRRHQSLEDASFDAWIKHYRQDENSPNSIVSYYSKGAMVAMCLDLELRLRTNGSCSLDDVMRAFWEEYGGDESDGVPEGGFERLAAQVSGVDLDDFFRQALRQTVDPPAGILLAQFGIRLHLRARESSGDRGGRPGKREEAPVPWLGFDLQVVGSEVRVRHVYSDGPARDAGVAAGDEIVAVNGRKVSPRNATARLNAASLDRSNRLHVFRRGRMTEIDIVATRPPRDTCYLQFETGADAATLDRRSAWLGT